MSDFLTFWRSLTIFNNHCGISYLFPHHSSSYSTCLLWCRQMGLDWTMHMLLIEPKLWWRTNRKFFFPLAALTLSIKKHSEQIDLKQSRRGVFITLHVSATVCFHKCSCLCNSVMDQHALFVTTEYFICLVSGNRVGGAWGCCGY